MRTLIVIFMSVLMTFFFSCNTSKGFIVDKSGSSSSDEEGKDDRASWGDRSEGNYLYEDYRESESGKEEKNSQSQKGTTDSSTSSGTQQGSQNTQESSTTSSSGGQSVSGKSGTDSQNGSTTKTSSGGTSSGSTSSGGSTGTVIAGGKTSNGGSSEKNEKDKLLREAYLKELKKKDDYKAVVALDEIKKRGVVSSSEVEELSKSGVKSPVIIGNIEREGKSAGLYEEKDYRAYESYQFKFRRKARLKSFNTINGPGKDYNLVQSALPGSNHYYFITDRINPLFSEDKKVLEESLDSYRSQFDDATYNKIKSAMSDVKKEKGTGYLEVMLCDAMTAKDGSTEVLINPRFITLKDSVKGNKLGFTVYYNDERKRLEMVFSAGGNLHLATSMDGEHFDYKGELAGVNSAYTDRDPSISPDGKVLVFASSRSFQSNLTGMQLYIATRSSLNSSFGVPQEVIGGVNTLGELFPSIFRSSKGTFILFKLFDKNAAGYNENLYSIEVRDGIFLPMVPFAEGSAVPHKYITISYSSKRGYRVMASYPVNDYDLYHMEIEEIKPVHVDAYANVLTPEQVEALKSYSGR